MRFWRGTTEIEPHCRLQGSPLGIVERCRMHAADVIHDAVEMLLGQTGKRRFQSRRIREVHLAKFTRKSAIRITR